MFSRTLLSLFLLMAIGVAPAATLQITSIDAVLHVDSIFHSQYSSASPEYAASLDANNLGQFTFTLTNNDTTLWSNARFNILLDMDIDALLNGYSNEAGIFNGLALPPGAPPSSLLADSWEIDEPGFVFGNIYSNFLAGTLDNTNAVPGLPLTPDDDVSLALSFFLGDIPVGGSLTITSFLSASDLNGLGQLDSSSAFTVYWNAYAEVSGSLGGGPLTPEVPEPSTGILIALSALALLHKRVRRVLLPALALAVVHAPAQTTARFTSTDDFLRGNIVNLNLNTPGALQINPPTGTQTFPFINVAASGRGTVVRIHTTSGQIVGEYATAPDGFSRNPSRTTVDLEGNVWAGNRDANYLDRGSVVKVGLIIGGTRTDATGTPDPLGGYLKAPFLYNTCLDRNRDGLIRTSRGLGDILPWTNVTDADGGTNGLVEDATDECILVYQTTPGTNTRHVTVDRDNNVWVAGYPYSLRFFAKLDGRTGAILDMFDARDFGCGGYGGVIDKNGILWSASAIEGYLLRYDPATRIGRCTAIPYAYGLAIAPGGDIWTASYGINQMFRVAPDGNIRASYPIDVSPNGPTGTAVNPADGHVWVANRFSHNVSHLDADGRQLKVIPVGLTPTGVAVDANNKIWVSNFDSSNVMRIDPAGGADGLGAVELTIDLGVPGLPPAQPYNYSDMTGVIAIGSTSPQGNFNITQDSGEAGSVWSLVEFNTEAGASVPAGSSLKVEVRASDNPSSFPEYTEVFSGIRFQKVGRYLEVRVTLRANSSGQSPVFTNLNLYGERRIEDLLSRAKDAAADIQWTPLPQAFAYNIYRGTDPNNLTLLRQNFIPTSSTLAIFPDTGLTNATPYYYKVRWVDRNGNESPDSILPSATATARTSRGLTSPTILSAPVVRGMQSTPYSYAVRASDPDTGDRLSYLLTAFPTGMTIDSATGLISWTPQPSQTGAQRVTLRVQDLGGRFATQSFDVFVSALRTNFPPAFTTTPPTTGTAGYPITYDANASDPNEGEILTFSLESGPAGMTVRASDGLLKWTPTLAQTGTHSVSLRVTDTAGASVLQSFQLNIGSNRPPVFTSAAPTSAGTGQRYLYAATASDPDGGPLTFEIVSAPTGLFVGPQSGNVEWTPQFQQAGNIPVTIRVKDPAGAAATQSFTINVAIANRPPVFVSTPNTSASATVPYTYDADATDPESTPIKYGLSAYPYNMAINSSTGIISWTPTVAQTGTHTVTVRATDNNGLNTFQTFVVTVGAADTTPPAVSITSPANGATVSSDITITGSVTDSNLRLWRVQYRPTGSTTWATLTTGSLPVVNGSLGRLPASLLPNNAYRLRLYAEDSGNAITTPEIEITVNTNRLKLGAMTMAFDDVFLANAPLPIVLRRLYDSTQAQPGDFGPGWKLGLSSLDLRLDVNNNAFITLPDGRRVAFAFTPTFSGFLGYFTTYTAAPGVADKLETVDCPLAFLSGGTYFCAFQPNFAPNAWKLTTRSGIVYEFDGSGKLTRISDRAGRIMTFSPSGIATNYGRSIAITRNAANSITRITDANGNLHRYDYDALGRLITYTNPRNEVSRFSYPATGQYLTSLQTPGNCNPLRVTYDTDGRVASKIDANNNAVTFTYDTANRTETQTDSAFQSTTRRYDASGNLLEVTDPLGNRTTYQYDAANNNTVLIEPSGRRVERTFDSRGNVLSQSVPGPTGTLTTTYSYTSLDQLAEVRNPLGDRIVYTYDAQGHRLSKQKRDAANNILITESWTYNAFGDQTSYTDGEGKTTTYSRNANGELTARTDATGRSTSYTYDLNGNITSFTGPDGQSQQLGYDGFNRLVRITQNGLVLRNMTRDEEGNVLSLTDALNRTTTYRYSCMGTLTGVTDPLGNFTANTYNQSGNLLTYSDTANRTTTYLYDAAQRPTRRTDPAGQFDQYAFNADGQESLHTNAAGQTNTFAYNGTFTTTSTARPEGQLLFSYDANSRLARVDDNRNASSRVTTLAYDGAGRLASINHPGGRTVSYTWNGRNQKTSVTAPDGTQSTFAYDDAGRLTRVTTGASNIQFTLDAAGRTSESLASNGVRSSYTYDTRGRLLSLTIRDAANSTLASFVYTRNNLGAITSRTATDGASIYAYDAANRLTQDGALTYSYDAAGNRLDSGAAFTFDHRLTSQGSTYDGAGRLLSRTNGTFGYDSQSMLTSFSAPGTTASYSYDFLNRRVSRTVNGDTVEYVYDGQNLLAEYRSGLPVAHYTFGPGLDKPLMLRRNGATYFYHLDPNGNVALITDSTGAVAHRYSYTAFGVLTSSTGSFSYSGSGLVNTLTFQAREFDSESGLYAFRARYYDAAIGRFLSKDPLLGDLRDPRTLHPYTFAFNDPVNAKDPTGKSSLVEYSFLISAPNITEQAGALIGFLQGFAIPQLRFLGEFLALEPSLDIVYRWDLAIANTESFISSFTDMLGYADYYADAPGFLGAYAGGASFEIGYDVSLNLGPLTYGFDQFKFSVSYGGFEEGAKNAINYLRALRPY